MMKVREWFEKTMKNEPDQADGPRYASTGLSWSCSGRRSKPAALTTPWRRHARRSHRPRVEGRPRITRSDLSLSSGLRKSAQTTTDHDEAHCREIGLARCPFSTESLPVKDGRSVAMTNTAFGAIHAEVDGQPHPLVDTAGYAPFGFGYRRCAGEYITIEFVKEYLRAIWREKVHVPEAFRTSQRVPNNPHTVLNDDITSESKVARNGAYFNVDECGLGG